MPNPLSLITLPVTGPIRLVHWLARVVQDEMENQAPSEDTIRAAMIVLIDRLDAGVIDEAAYDREEQELLSQLDAIRARRESRS